MQNSLKDLLGKEGDILEMADLLFIGRELDVHAEFKQKFEDEFIGKLISVDLSDVDGASNYINDWIDTFTNGKIKQLVPKIDYFSYAISANFVLINSAWKYPFERFFLFFYYQFIFFYYFNLILFYFILFFLILF